MRDPPRDKLWYKIVLIRLDLLCDQSCDLITLQLSSFLDTSFDKHIAFEIITLVGKNSLNLMRN